jgi:hypothetical protein
MKSMLKKAFNLLSEKQRHRIYRMMLNIPNEFQDPHFRVEIARTKEDLECAYALLHDCYVGIKIMDPQPSGLHCNLFSFLPTSTIIVAKYKGHVVGTLNAIKDSSSGLPSDREFKKENDRFRTQGKVLIEASALAVAPEYRRNHGVSLLIMKYLYNYCRFCFRGDYMVGAVHPRSEDFYKALWQFEKNGKPSQYGSLKGAAAIHISMDLSKEHFEKVIRTFGPDDPSRNIGSLFLQPDSRFQYPEQVEGLSIHPVMNPETLKYFCLAKPGVWRGLCDFERQRLIEVYSTYFGRESMRAFRKLEVAYLNEKEFRTPVQIPSMARIGNVISFCEVLDLASKGCFVSWSSNQLPELGQTLSISFWTPWRNYSLEGRVAWHNEGQALRLGPGFGIHFSQESQELARELPRWLYRNQIEPAFKFQVAT